MSSFQDLRQKPGQSSSMQAALNYKTERESMHCLCVTRLGFCLRVNVNKKSKSWKDDIKCSICVVINQWFGVSPIAKFQNRVISNRLEYFWPVKSPDQISQDFFFCGIDEMCIYDAKPRSLDQTKKAMEKRENKVTRDTLIKAAKNFRKRATFCFWEWGR